MYLDIIIASRLVKDGIFNANRSIFLICSHIFQNDWNLNIKIENFFGDNGDFLTCELSC